jgi:hypothetical protein
VADGAKMQPIRASIGDFDQWPTPEFRDFTPVSQYFRYQSLSRDRNPMRRNPAGRLKSGATPVPVNNHTVR